MVTQGLGHYRPMELAVLGSGEVWQHYVFGFDVPYLFHCHFYPCPTSTDCFVSRAMEKMIFLNFLFGMEVSCFLLTLVELHCLGWVFTRAALFAACASCCHILPCSTLMKTGLGSRCPLASKCLQTLAQ